MRKTRTNEEWPRAGRTTEPQHEGAACCLKEPIPGYLSLHACTEPTGSPKLPRSRQPPVPSPLHETGTQPAPVPGERPPSPSITPGWSFLPHLSGVGGMSVIPPLPWLCGCHRWGGSPRRMKPPLRRDPPHVLSHPREGAVGTEALEEAGSWPWGSV